MLEIRQKVQPDDCHQERSNRPLPTLKLNLVIYPSKYLNSYFKSFASIPVEIIVYAEIKYEDYCQQVDHPVHEVVELEISPLHLKHHGMKWLRNLVSWYILTLIIWENSMMMFKMENNMTKTLNFLSKLPIRRPKRVAVPNTSHSYHCSVSLK